jgi:hypothetical protein
METHFPSTSGRDTDILEFICNENERDSVHLPGK